MTNIVRFDDFGSEIRVTEDGRYSVYDVIKFCGKKNPRQVWEELCETFPSLLDVVAMYKFPGQGQRQTPVLEQKICNWMIDFLKGKYHAEASVLVKGCNIGEANFRDALARFYKECGESVRTEVSTGSGVADIVTNTTVIEVKQLSGWKHAIGQAIAYSLDLGLYPEVALYGDIVANKADHVMHACTQAQIACSIWDTRNGDAFAFTLDMGFATLSNLELLTKMRVSSHEAALN